MSIGEDKLPDNNWTWALAASHHTLALAQSGNRAEDIREAREARAILARVFGDDDPRVVPLRPLI